jgi:hypothetical protein
MMMKKHILDYLNDDVDIAWKLFNEEINTDENKDYRRGFRAGILCAFLQTKVNVMENIKDVD